MNLCEKVAFIALKDTKGPEIWLEDSTERSNSNPGRSLGICRARRNGCLEDSTSLVVLLRLRLSPHAFKRFTDNADATDFIFSRILFLLVLPVDIGFTTDCICAYTALDSCLVVLLLVKVYCN